MKNKKVLVVGGAGFVGSNLCHKLIEKQAAHVCVVDNLSSATADNLPVIGQSNNNVPGRSGFEFIYGSISDDRVVCNLDKDFDYVFHLSTYHGNQSSIANPIADHEHNTLTTLKLCEHFKDAPKLKAMVYAGAGCTVAEKTFDDATPTNEEAGVSLYLDSPYQISKIIGEFYGNYYYMRHKLPFIKARFQNVYGPREVLGAGLWRGTPATVWRNVIPSFIFRALNNEGLTVENGGIATRDFIYVDDLVDGLIACAENGKPAEVYNLATGVETSIKELAEMINEKTANPAAIDYKPAREWDRSGKRCGTTDKSLKEINFAAKVNISEGLDLTINWIKDNLDGITNHVMRHKYYMPELEKYQK